MVKYYVENTKSMSERRVSSLYGQQDVYGLPLYPYHTFPCVFRKMHGMTPGCSVAALLLAVTH